MFMGKSMLPMLVIAVLFIAGVLLGCVVSLHVNGEGLIVLNDYLNNITNKYNQNSSVVWMTILSTYIYPVSIFIFGFTVLGVLVIPLTVALKGFLLSFMITSFIKVFSIQGLLYSAVIMVVPAVIMLPCMFVLATQGGFHSLALLFMYFSKGRHMDAFILPRNYVTKFIVCLVALFFSVIYEIYLSPMFISAIVK